MRVRWQDDAVADLQQIRRFIALNNPSAASAVAIRLRDVVPLLAESPGLGRPGRIPGTRELVLADIPHIIPFRVEGHTLVILRVLHTAKRWPLEG